MYRRLVLFCFVLFSLIFSFAEEKHFDDSKVVFDPVLQLRLVEASNPKLEAEKAYQSGDTRFIAVMGFARSCPGLKHIYFEALEIHGFRILTGGTDDIPPGVYEDLVPALYRYAEAYNKNLFRLLDAKVQKELEDFKPKPPLDPFVEFGY